VARASCAWPFSRIVLAILATAVPVALVIIFANAALERSMRIAWPQLLAALLCVAGYHCYVNRIERREMSELALPGSTRETVFGLAAGVALNLATIGLLAASGAFQVEGYNRWTVALEPIAELVLVALFEEIVFRAILFRIVESSLCTRVALLISVVLFALAHLPNQGISGLGVPVTGVAGLMLAAAYLVTRRLWLAVGVHFAWNFMSDAIFSLPVSGHPAKGWIQGKLVGPEWLTGGAYGVEASVVTLAVLTGASIILLLMAARRDRA
jgi:hypothetical protein